MVKINGKKVPSEKAGIDSINHQEVQNRGRPVFY